MMLRRKKKNAVSDPPIWEKKDLNYNLFCFLFNNKKKKICPVYI
jgi:hypothetical protein